LAVGKTDIPGLEGLRFDGGSTKVRRAAELPEILDSGGSGDVLAPRHLPSSALDNAEGDVLAKVHDAIVQTNADPEAVQGTVNIVQSNKNGVCGGCRAGLRDPSRRSGVIKQFSEEHPNVRVNIYTLQTDGTMVITLSVLNGHYI
jgi:hypothetical protein